jgi:hypothetical protein
MGEAYRIGVSAGAGVAIGLVAAALLARLPRGGVGAGVLAALIAGVVGWIVFGWPEATAGALGGLSGGVSTAVFARGSLRRGGTAAGTALLLLLSAVAVFLIALIPVAGYLEALVLPVVAARARRRAGEKYAGLRTLAR